MNKPISLAEGKRFAFGRNWSSFLERLTDENVSRARQSLSQLESIEGKTFLDIGSGSGLFSLAARQLGAKVHSFDYDPHSVSCTATLKQRYFPTDPNWIVEQGSVLDERYVEGLGQFDVVYSWGVLHHTGNLHQALQNVAFTVKRGGLLVIAVYNDQGALSKYWRAVKRLYNANRVLQWAIIGLHLPLLFTRLMIRACTGRLIYERGMSMWHDFLDWLGGYPFEVAKPEQVFEFLRDRGFRLERLKTCGGRSGCNEFVFCRG